MAPVGALVPLWLSPTASKCAAADIPITELPIVCLALGRHTLNLRQGYTALLLSLERLRFDRKAMFLRQLKEEMSAIINRFLYKWGRFTGALGFPHVMRSNPSPALYRRPAREKFSSFVKER